MSDLKKKTWHKLTDFKLTSWLSNKSFLNAFFFSLNSMKLQLPFYTLLNTRNNFLTENFLKTIGKIQICQTHAHSINFKIVSLESSLHCGPDEKNCIQFCVHAQAWSSSENVQSKKYCIPEAMYIGRRKWRHILFNFWR